MSDASRSVERVFRKESGRILATLIRVLGDFDLADEATKHGAPEAERRRPAGEMFSICGAAALYRRKIILKFGGFDEDGLDGP